MVGLGNVDNTSDANKPVSTAQATAIGLKAPSINAAFTGTLTWNGSNLLKSNGITFLTSTGGSSFC